MPNNKKIKISADDFLKVPLNLFKTIGFDLNERNSQNLTSREQVIKILRKIYFFNVILNLLTVLIMNILQVMKSVSFKDSFLFVLNSNYYSSILFKLFVLVYQKQKILQLFENLRQNFPQNKTGQDRYQTDKSYQKFSNFWNFYRGMLRVTAIIMIITTLAILSNHDEKYDHVFIVKPTGILSTTFNVICASCTIIIMLKVQALLDLLFETIATVLVISFNTISRDFKSELSKPDLNMKSLKILVERHTKLNELAEKIQNIYSPIFLYSFLNSSVTIALFCADMTVGDAVAKISGLVSFAFISLHTFLPYYHGQKVYDSSSKVFYSIIDSKWYNIKDESVKKSVAILLTTSQNPVYFTGCDFFVVDRETYMDLLTSAYSYFTLLINIH